MLSSCSRGQMRGLAFSHDEPSLDPISDKLEALFRRVGLVSGQKRVPPLRFLMAGTSAGKER